MTFSLCPLFHSSSNKTIMTNLKNIFFPIFLTFLQTNNIYHNLGQVESPSCNATRSYSILVILSV